MTQDTADAALETPLTETFRPPSIDSNRLEEGASYSHYSALPGAVCADTSTECVLGIDEAGRGPVLG